MSVNLGGLGSNIKFSDLQTFYGGEHPISLSEYYRGGAEVPSTVLSGNNPYTGTTSFSGSGSGSGGNHGIAVTVDTTPGSPGALTTQTWTNSGAGTIGFRSFENDRGNIVFGELNITNDTSIARVVFNTGSGAVRGPAWQNGHSGLGLSAAQVAALDQVTAGTRIVASAPSNGASLNGGLTGRVQVGAATPATHDISFTNNTGQRISLASSSTGGARTMNRGDSVQVQNDGSSNAWSFSYSYVDAGSGSGTGDETNDGVVTNVTSVPGPTTGSAPNRNRVDFSDRIGSYTVTAQDAFIFLAVGGGDPDRGTTMRYSVNGVEATARDGNQTASVGFRGPRGSGAFSAFRGFAPSVQTVAVNTGDVIRFVSGPRSQGELQVFRDTRTTGPDVFDITFMNGTGSDIILDSDSTGGARTITNGETVQVQNDGSSSNWRFDYRFAPSIQQANTDIPEMGTTRLDQFNAPGNAAP